MFIETLLLSFAAVARLSSSGALALLIFFLQNLLALVFLCCLAILPKVINSPFLPVPAKAPCSARMVKYSLEYFQGWRLHNLSGPPVPLLSHPHSEKVFQFLPLVLSVHNIPNFQLKQSFVQKLYSRNNFSEVVRICLWKMKVGLERTVGSFHTWSF